MYTLGTTNIFLSIQATPGKHWTHPSRSLKFIQTLLVICLSNLSGRDHVWLTSIYCSISWSIAIQDCPIPNTRIDNVDVLVNESVKGKALLDNLITSR